MNFLYMINKINLTYISNLMVNDYQIIKLKF